MLIDLVSGSVHSIDHGSWCGAASTQPVPQVVVSGAEAILPDVGRDWDLVEPAVDAIEAMTDEQLLKSAAPGPRCRDRRESSSEPHSLRVEGLDEVDTGDAHVSSSGTDSRSRNLRRPASPYSAQRLPRCGLPLADALRATAASLLGDAVPVT